MTTQTPSRPARFQDERAKPKGPGVGATEESAVGSGGADMSRPARHARRRRRRGLTAQLLAAADAAGQTHPPAVDQARRDGQTGDRYRTPQPPEVNAVVQLE